MIKARDKLKFEIIDILDANGSMTIEEISTALGKYYCYISTVMRELWLDNKVEKSNVPNSIWDVVYHPIKKEK